MHHICYFIPRQQPSNGCHLLDYTACEAIPQSTNGGKQLKSPPRAVNMMLDMSIQPTKAIE